jgi:MinD-like ATPase involved in chromosome partitioning or flagellar assembly
VSVVFGDGNFVSASNAPVVTPSDRQPLSRLRMRVEQHKGRLWAFASGSGGVGRSTLAAALGTRLTLRGCRVCLVDADWSGPSLASMLDVPASSARSPWDGERLVPERTPFHADLRLVAGAPPVLGDPSRRACRQLREQIEALDFDRVVLDLPAGTHDAALDLWLAADQPMVVAVPERLPLEATARLLARTFARLVRPWLGRKLGAERADQVLAEGWDACAGRTGTWMRSVARVAGLPTEELAARAGRKPLYLVLNRVRRGDDVDVGHALVTAAGHGLGLDLRFRAVIPFEDEGWIRARRTGGHPPGCTDLLGAEIDDLLARMDEDVDVPSLGDWRWSLREAAGAVHG